MHIYQCHYYSKSEKRLPAYYMLTESIIYNRANRLNGCQVGNDEYGCQRGMACMGVRELMTSMVVRELMASMFVRE